MSKEEKIQVSMLIAHKRSEMNSLREAFALSLEVNDDRLGHAIIKGIAMRRVDTKRLERLLGH